MKFRNSQSATPICEFWTVSRKYVRVAFGSHDYSSFAHGKLYVCTHGTVLKFPAQKTQLNDDASSIYLNLIAETSPTL